MLKYTITVKNRHRPLAVISFEDQKYKLLGSFLMGERSFRKQILSTILLQEQENAENGMSGNVFSLDIKDGTAFVTDDITGESISVSADELYRAAKDYFDKVDDL